MTETSNSGYLDYDGKIYRLRRARCQFHKGELDAEGQSNKCLVKLYGLRFPINDIEQLAGQTFGPETDGLNSDPLAEGGIEMGEETMLTWTSLTVRVKKVDIEKKILTLSFQADVEDPEWGNSGSVDGSLVCDIKDRLW
jgi:hypothetical protein